MNQAKQRQFENFNFEKNVAWKEYISEFDPSIPKERIEKIKKTWYKENIDPDYNSEYTNTQQSTNSSASTSQASEYSQKSSTYKALFELENYLKLGFIVTAILSISVSTKIAFVVCALVLYRQKQSPQWWSKQCASELIHREYGQNIIFLTGFFFVGSFRILYSLPLMIHFWIGIAEYLNIKGGVLYQMLQKQVNTTRVQKDYLMDLKYQMEIALVPLSLILLFLSSSSLLTVVFFGNFLRIKYMLNSQLQRQCQFVNSKYLEPHKSKPGIGFIITKIQDISRYLTKTR